MTYFLRRVFGRKKADNDTESIVDRRSQRKGSSQKDRHAGSSWRNDELLDSLPEYKFSSDAQGAVLDDMWELYRRRWTALHRPTTREGSEYLGGITSIEETGAEEDDDDASAPTQPTTADTHSSVMKEENIAVVNNEEHVLLEDMFLQMLELFIKTYADFNFETASQLKRNSTYSRMRYSQFNSAPSTGGDSTLGTMSILSVPEMIAVRAERVCDTLGHPSIFVQHLAAYLLCTVCSLPDANTLLADIIEDGSGDPYDEMIMNQMNYILLSSSQEKEFNEMIDINEGKKKKRHCQKILLCLKSLNVLTHWHHNSMVLILSYGKPFGMFLKTFMSKLRLLLQKTIENYCKVMNEENLMGEYEKIELQTDATFLIHCLIHMTQILTHFSPELCSSTNDMLPQQPWRFCDLLSLGLMWKEDEMISNEYEKLILKSERCSNGYGAFPVTIQERSLKGEFLNNLISIDLVTELLEVAQSVQSILSTQLNVTMELLIERKTSSIHDLLSLGRMAIMVQTECLVTFCSFLSSSALLQSSFSGAPSTLFLNSVLTHSFPSVTLDDDPQLQHLLVRRGMLCLRANFILSVKVPLTMNPPNSESPSRKKSSSSRDSGKGKKSGSRDVSLPAPSIAGSSVRTTRGNVQYSLRVPDRSTVNMNSSLYTSNQSFLCSGELVVAAATASTLSISSISQFLAWTIRTFDQCDGYTKCFEGDNNNIYAAVECLSSFREVPRKFDVWPWLLSKNKEGDSSDLEWPAGAVDMDVNDTNYYRILFESVVLGMKKIISSLSAYVIWDGIFIELLGSRTLTEESGPSGAGGGAAVSGFGGNGQRGAGGSSSAPIRISRDHIYFIFAIFDRLFEQEYPLYMDSIKRRPEAEYQEEHNKQEKQLDEQMTSSQDTDEMMAAFDPTRLPICQLKFVEYISQLFRAAQAEDIFAIINQFRLLNLLFGDFFLMSYPHLGKQMEFILSSEHTTNQNNVDSQKWCNPKSQQDYSAFFWLMLHDGILDFVHGLVIYSLYFYDSVEDVQSYISFEDIMFVLIEFICSNTVDVPSKLIFQIGRLIMNLDEIVVSVGVDENPKIRNKILLRLLDLSERFLTNSGITSLEPSSVIPFPALDGSNIEEQSDQSRIEENTDEGKDSFEWPARNTLLLLIMQRSTLSLSTARQYYSVVGDDENKPVDTTDTTVSTGDLEFPHWMEPLISGYLNTYVEKNFRGNDRSAQESRDGTVSSFASSRQTSIQGQSFNEADVSGLSIHSSMPFSMMNSFKYTSTQSFLDMDLALANEADESVASTPKVMGTNGVSPLHIATSLDTVYETDRIQTILLMLLEPRSRSAALQILLEIITQCAEQYVRISGSIGVASAFSINDNQFQEELQRKKTDGGRISARILHGLLDVVSSSIDYPERCDGPNLALSILRGMMSQLRCRRLQHIRFCLQEYYRRCGGISLVLQSIARCVKSSNSTESLEMHMCRPGTVPRSAILRQGLSLLTSIMAFNESCKIDFGLICQNKGELESSVDHISSQSSQQRILSQNDVKRTPSQDRKTFKTFEKVFDSISDLVLSAESSPEKETLIVLYELILDGTLFSMDEDFRSNQEQLPDALCTNDDDRPKIRNLHVIPELYRIIGSCTLNNQKFVLESFLNLIQGRASLGNLNSCALTQPTVLDLVLDLFQLLSDEMHPYIVLLLQALGRHGISVSVLKKLFRLLQSKGPFRPTYSYHVIEAMQGMIREEEDCPRRSFAFEGLDSGLKFPCITKWPISKAFTFCVWLKVETPKLSSDISGILDTNQTGLSDSVSVYCPHVICLRDGNGTGIECYLRPVGQQLKNRNGTFNVVLKYHSEAGETSMLSPDVNGMNIKEGIWHFLAFTVSTASFFGSKGEASIQLDHQNIRHPFQVPKFPEPILEPTIGTCPQMFQQNRHNSTLRGQMGAFYMFSEALSEMQLRCMHALGPNYQSNFEQFSISYGEISQRAKKHQVDPKNILDGSLTGSIILTCNAAVWNGDQFLDNTPVTNDVRWKVPNVSTTSRKGAVSLIGDEGQMENNHVQMHAKRLPGTYRSSTQDVRMALNSLGGVKSILPMFAQIDQPRIKMSNQHRGDVSTDKNSKNIKGVSASKTNDEKLISSKESKLDYGYDSHFLPAILELMISLLDGNIESWSHYARFRIGIISTLLERATPRHFSQRVLDLFILLHSRLLAHFNASANKFTDIYLELILCNFKLWSFADVNVQLNLLDWIENGVKASAVYPQSPGIQFGISPTTDAVSFRRIVDVMYLLYDYDLPTGIENKIDTSGCCSFSQNDKYSDHDTNNADDKKGLPVHVELHSSIFLRKKWIIPGTADKVVAERLVGSDLQHIRNRFFMLLQTILIAQKALLPENIQDLIQYCLQTTSVKSKMEIINFLSGLLFNQEHLFLVPHTLLGLAVGKSIQALSVLLFHRDLLLRTMTFSFICQVVNKARGYKILPPVPVDQRTRMPGNDGNQGAQNIKDSPRDPHDANLHHREEEAFAQALSVALPITSMVIDGSSSAAKEALLAVVDSRGIAAEESIFSETMTSLGLGAEHLTELINFNTQAMIHAAADANLTMESASSHDCIFSTYINCTTFTFLCTMMGHSCPEISNKIYELYCSDHDGREQACKQLIDVLVVLLRHQVQLGKHIVLPCFALPLLSILTALPVHKNLYEEFVKYMAAAWHYNDSIALSVCRLPHWHRLMVDFLWMEDHFVVNNQNDAESANRDAMEKLRNEVIESIITSINFLQMPNVVVLPCTVQQLVGNIVSNSVLDRIKVHQGRLLAIHGAEIMNGLRGTLTTSSNDHNSILQNLNQRFYFYKVFLPHFKTTTSERILKMKENDFMESKLLHIDAWMAISSVTIALQDLQTLLERDVMTNGEAQTHLDTAYDAMSTVFDLVELIQEKIALHLYSEDSFNLFTNKPVAVDMNRDSGKGSRASSQHAPNDAVRISEATIEHYLNAQLDSAISTCNLINGSGGIHWLLIRSLGTLLSCYVSVSKDEISTDDKRATLIADVVTRLRALIQLSLTENRHFFQLESLHLLLWMRSIGTNRQILPQHRALEEELIQQNQQLLLNHFHNEAKVGESNATDESFMNTLFEEQASNFEHTILNKLQSTVDLALQERDTSVLRQRFEQIGFQKETVDTFVWTLTSHWKETAVNTMDIDHLAPSYRVAPCTYKMALQWFNEGLAERSLMSEQFALRLKFSIRQTDAANRRFDMRWTKIFRELANERGPWGYGASDRNQTFWMLGSVEAAYNLKRVLRRNDQGTSHAIATQRAKGMLKTADNDDGTVKSSEAEGIVGIYKDLQKYKKKNNTNTDQKEEEEEDDGNSEGEDYTDTAIADDQGPATSGAQGTAIDLIASQAFNIINNESAVLFSAEAEIISSATNSAGCRSQGRIELTRARMSFTRQSESSNFDFVNKSNNDEFLWACQCYPSFTWGVEEISGVYRRYYQLRYVAVEVFFVNRTSVFINLFSKKNCKIFIRIIRTKLRPPQCSEVFVGRPVRAINAIFMPGLTVTQAWVQRKITNFEYLMHLNFIAGRTFNDLSQYPVFPWVIADYNSYYADLRNPSFFRNFKWPMGAQKSQQRAILRRTYENSKEMADMEILPYHTGSHYSTSAMVIWYLIRMEPFTSYHVWLQDGKFDHSDRLFYSLPACYNGCTSNPQDVKELIPEFFYNAEILDNVNRVELGTTQKGVVIDDVILPAWAKDSLDFVRIHRDALESDYVSMNLHHWIDLIFGYKQRPPHIRGGNESAVEACNVYMHLTYADAVNLDDIKAKDPMLYERLIRQIENFGQTPSKIFHRPHPSRLPFDHIDLTWPIASIVPGVDTIIRGSRIKLDKPTRVLTYGEFKVSSSPILIIFDFRNLERLITVDATRVIGYHNFQWRPPDIVPPFVMKVDKYAVSASSGQLMASGGKKSTRSLLNYGYGSSSKDKMAGIPFAAQAVLAPKSIGRAFPLIKDFDYSLIGTPSGKGTFIEEQSQSRKKSVLETATKSTSKTSRMTSGGMGLTPGSAAANSVRSMSSSQMSRAASSASDVQYRFDSVGIPQRISPTQSSLRSVDNSQSESPATSRGDSSTEKIKGVAAADQKTWDMNIEGTLTNSPLSRSIGKNDIAENVGKDSPLTSKKNSNSNSGSNKVSDSVGEGSNAAKLQRREHVADHLSGNLFAILPDSKFLFSCGHWDNSFKVTLVDSGKIVQSVSHHKEVVTCLTVASDNGRHWLVTGSRDCIVIIWELNLLRENEPIVYPPSFYLYGHDDTVNCVAVNAELDLVVSGSDDGTLMLHSLRDGSYLRSILIGVSLSSNPWTMNQANRKSHKGKTFRSDSRKSTFLASSRRANGSSSLSLAAFEDRPKHRVSLLAISSDGFIVSYCIDGNLLSTHTVNGRYVKSVDARERLYALCLSEDNRVLVSGGERCLVVMRWVSNLSIANNGPRRDLDCVVDGAHEPDYASMKSPIRSLHLTAQERHLVVGLESGVIRVLAQDSEYLRRKLHRKLMEIGILTS